MNGNEDTPVDEFTGAHAAEHRETSGEENRGGDEPEARQGAGSSVHVKLEKNNVLAAGTVSRRGTRPGSIVVMYPNRCLYLPDGTMLRHASDILISYPGSAKQVCPVVC